MTNQTRFRKQLNHSKALVWGLLLGLCFSVPAKLAYPRTPSVDICVLGKDWRKYDGKMVKVRGWINVNFENFSLAGDCQGGIGLNYSDGNEGERLNGFATTQDVRLKEMTRLKDERWPYRLPPHYICSVDCGVRKYRVHVTIIGRFRSEPDYSGGVRLVLVIRSVKDVSTELMPDTTPPEFKP